MPEDQEELLEEQEEMDLYIIFTIADGLFCVNCSSIGGIMQLEECTPVPDSPREVRGVMKNRGLVYTLFDIRAALNLGFMQQERQSFCEMIDARKGDHERWVKAFKETVENDVPFTLATDPHKCALGMWRDSFRSDIKKANSLMNRLDEPHGHLHRSALEVLRLKQNPDTPANRKMINSIYTQVEKVHMPAVLSILEEIKETFRDSVFREMVITLNSGENRGIIVENIHSVETLKDVSDEHGGRQFINQPYIRAVKQSDRISGLILELDPFELIRSIGEFEVPPM